MKNWIRKFSAFGLAVLLGTVIGLSTEAMAKEKVVTIGDNSPVPSLDPASSTVSPVTYLCRNIFQGLLRYKFNSTEIEGDLAEGWNVSKDGLLYSFKLRDNILFHKGFGKVTAYDVKFSFDRIMDPQTRSPFGGEVTAAVKEVKVIDNHRVEIHLKARDASFLHKCTRPKPVAIVSKDAVEKYGKDFTRNPIGSGPFAFQSMAREQVVLVANQEYWEGPPKIDKLIWKTIPDPDTLVMAIQRGEVDIIQNVPREKAVIDRLRASGCQIKVMNRGAWHHLMFNPQFKPFADVRVRRAVAHAIDRDMIIEHVFGGNAWKLNSPVPEGFFGHTGEGLRRYDFDPKKAKKLLAEAGYPNGFEVTFDAPNSSAYVPVVTAMQDQLGKVGIKVNPVVTDLPTWLKKVTSATAHLVIYLPVRSPDADFPLTNFLHSAGFSPGTNMFRYDKLDKEIDEARSEMDPTRRRKIYHEIQKKLMEDVPIVPLFMMPFPTPYRPHLAGIPDRDPLYGFNFHLVHFSEKK